MQERRLSAHRVSLCVLLKLHLSDDLLDADAKRRLGQFLLREVQAAEDIHETSLPDLIAHFKSWGNDGHVVSNAFLSELQQMDSPDHLFRVFTDLKALYSMADESRMDTEVVLDPNSIFGVFARRMVLTFQKSMFEGLSRLFDRFVLYRLELEGGSGGVPEGQESPVLSLCQLEKYVNKQAAEIEGSIRTKPAKEVGQAIDQLIARLPHYPKAHYLRYLHSVHHKEHESAIDSLCHYFDYTLKTVAKSDVTDGAGANGLTNIVQYSILNLASVHFRFGDYRAALQAISGTVCIAQENNDRACLAQALAWLHRVMKAIGDPSHAASLLDRSAVMMQPLQAPLVSALICLEMAQHRLLHMSNPKGSNGCNGSTAGLLGRPYLPMFEALQRSAHLQMEPAGSTVMAGVRSRYHLVKAGIWETFGHFPLAELYIKLSMECPPIDDDCFTLCRRALMLKENHYSEALRVLQQLAQQNTVTSLSLWPTVAGSVVQDRCLLRCQLAMARHLALTVTSRVIACNDFESSLDTLFRWSRIFVSEGALQIAQKSILKSIHVCESRGMHVQRAHHLLLLADVCQRSGQISICLPFLLHCLTLCSQYNLHQIRACASIKLAFVRLETGHPQDALILLEEIHPIVLQHCSVYIRGYSSFVQAKCRLTLAYRTQTTETRVALMSAAVTALQTAHKLFSETDSISELRDCVYLEARVYNELGRVDLRNKASLQFVRLERELLLMPSRTDSCLNSQQMVNQEAASTWLRPLLVV
eukprot:GILK01012274.1.p1 GENE.GILK01012274.1~~GILK01012274.1.p1  ORF type:complete len:770 (-),score=119.13 GILK01012274.1:32-2305(-)